jgi:hypothetical protein
LRRVDLEQLVKELLETIAQEVKSLERFLALLLDQENLLLNNRLSSLPGSWEKQRKALSLARSLEKKRLLITDRVSEEFKIDKNEFDLCPLSDLLEESYSARIEALQKTLLDLHRKVETQRKKNQKLIRESRGFLTRGKKTSYNSLIRVRVGAKGDPEQRRIRRDCVSQSW